LQDNCNPEAYSNLRMLQLPMAMQQQNMRLHQGMGDGCGPSDPKLPQGVFPGMTHLMDPNSKVKDEHLIVSVDFPADAMLPTYPDNMHPGGHQPNPNNQGKPHATMLPDFLSVPRTDPKFYG